MIHPFVGSLLLASVGVTIEVALTGVVRLRKKRDWSLEGYSYVWMIPIYMLAWPILSFLYPRIEAWNFVLRGILYTTILLFVEYVSGLLLRKLLGECPWEKQYKGKKWAVNNLVRLDYAPGWLVVALVFEQLYLSLQ